MQAVQGKNTKPELTVRRFLHRMGYRYRLHRKDLPGTPDLVFPSQKKAIFVHGCFWHQHGCRYGQPPKSRRGYWIPKLKRNKQRDSEKLAELERAGWKAMVIWECEIRGDLEDTENRLLAFLNGASVDNADRHVERQEVE
nr:very short patch repair endonuclease [Ferruginivarius sediminum]